MATFNGQVAASADDATERADDSNFASNAVTNIIRSNSSAAARNHVAFRIPNVTIPAGATINSATASVYVFVDTQDDPNLDIFCEDVDDAADFATNADIVNRTLTSASAAWVATGIGTGAKTTPDFAAALQEVVDRPGWASGQDVVVFLWARSDTDARLAIRMQDNGTGDGPSIAVDYTEAAAGVEIGLTSEGDSALGVTAVKAGALGLASEGETALPMVGLKTAVLGLVSESDSALTVEAAGGGGSYADKALALGAVAGYPLNEESGSTADNVEGMASLDGTYTGVTLANQAGPTDGNDAPYFDGSNDYVTLPHAALDGVIDGADFTLSLWLDRTTHTDEDTLFYIETTTGDSIWLRGRVSADGYRLEVVAGGALKAVQVRSVDPEWVDPTDWVNITVTRKESTSTIKFYMDGALADERSDSSGAWGGTLASAFIGAKNATPDNPFDGHIAEVYLFDSALSDEDIASLADPAGGGAAATEIGLASEGDSALGLTAVKTAVLGLVSEGDEALGVTAVKLRPLGLVSSADAALGLTGLKVGVIGLSLESDSALGVSLAGGVAVIGLVPEADAALGMTAVKSRALGLATEVDSGLGLLGVKELVLGLVTEADSALVVGGLKVGALGSVVESGSGLGLAGLKVLAIGLVSESDGALDLTNIGTLLLEIYMASVLANLSPTAVIRVNISPAADIDANPGPDEALFVG